MEIPTILAGGIQNRRQISLLARFLVGGSRSLKLIDSSAGEEQPKVPSEVSSANDALRANTGGIDEGHLC